MRERACENAHVAVSTDRLVQQLTEESISWNK